MAVQRFTKRLETDAVLARKVKRLQAMLLIDSAEKPRFLKVVIGRSR